MGKMEKVGGIFPWLTLAGGLVLGKNWETISKKIKETAKKVKREKEEK